MCDEWCLKDHGPDECPRQYECSKNAEKHNMEALKILIDSIKQGKCRPGEGLPEPYIEKYMPHTPLPRQQRLRKEKVGSFGDMVTVQKFQNSFLFLFIRAGLNKMFFRIVSRKDTDQTASLEAA